MRSRNKSKIVFQPEKVSLRECLGIFKDIRMPWMQMALAFALTVVAALASLQVATFSGDMIDASGALPVKELITYVVAQLLYVALTAGSMLLQGLASEKINFGLRQKLWGKIIYTKQSCYDKDGGENLVSRVTTDCEYACNFFTNVVSIVSLLATSVMYLVRLYQLNASMANYVLIFIPVSIVVGFAYTVLRFFVAQRAQGMLAGSTAYLVERTKDLPLIKTSNAQKMEIELGRQHFQKQYEAQLRIGFASIFHSAIDQLLSLLSTAIPFLVGAVFVSQGILTVGAVVTFNGLFGNAKTSFSSLILYLGNMKEANGALARVTRVLQLPEEAPEQGTDLGTMMAADVSLDEVEFSYTDRMILKQFTCQIPKGKVTAVIGRNGSGKSTLFKIIERLYEPDSGKVRFGETDAAEYSLHSWRKRFCLIAQGSPLMSGTIRENMCYGREDAVSNEELLRVAKLSHVYDFVHKLPQGFDTMVEPGGANFSGGQRQCIAIARAMLNPGDYLLLDEVTSNLDAKKEREVMDAMQKLMQGRTTLIIAHSLAAIRNADHVIVINKGRVEDTGSPGQILEKTDNFLARVMAR